MTARVAIGSSLFVTDPAILYVLLALEKLCPTNAFDCLGAKAAGMRSAFIDRRNRPFGGTQYQAYAVPG